MRKKKTDRAKLAKREPASGRAERLSEKGPEQVAIDWETVKKLCAMQCTLQEIASFLGIHKTTLDNACKENWDMSPGEKFEEWRLGGKCSLRRKQWMLAEKNASMAIFLGKQYLDQLDNYNVHHEGDTTVEVVHFGSDQARTWNGGTYQEERNPSAENTDS